MKMYNKSNHSLYQLLFALVLFQTCLATVYATEIKTTIDRNSISINESFQLTYTATESPDNDPDFSPLDMNFDILNQSQISRSLRTNQQSSRTNQWVLKLMPKKTGILTIPAIRFGDDVSSTTTIIVTKSAPANQNNTDELFLKVEITPETVYVQSQVLYTLRLFRRVQITQASLNEPTMQDAVIEKLGEDKNFNTKVNGVDYVVTERKYAIFPQKSGFSTLEPLVLTAEIVSSTRPRFNSFFNRRSTVTKRVTSEAITIDVKAAPDNFKGKQWIPAENVYIEEKWSGDTENIKVGEPLTRTLTILAKGTTVAQLPELHSESDITQIKTYPDQPVLKEKKGDDGLIAFREEKIAYIPSKSGSFTLPAIEISWFNTETETMEIARIAEKTITAIAAAHTQSNEVAIEPPTPTNTITSAPGVKTVESKLWMWISCLLAIGWLITLYFLVRKPKEKQQEKPINPKEIKLKEIVKALKKACAINNPVAAKDALLAWGKIKFNSDNLANTATHCEARLRDEIYSLNQSLYANQAKPWQGKKLFKFFSENRAREKVAKKSNDALEPLYKA